MTSKRKVAGVCVAVLAAGLIVVAASIYVRDMATVRTAIEVDSAIVAYCLATGTLPSRSLVRSRFPDLTTDIGWFFFGDDESYLKVQYPMSWWNGAAIGRPQISEFTGTVYSYVIAYDCTASK